MSRKISRSTKVRTASIWPAVLTAVLILASPVIGSASPTAVDASGLGSAEERIREAEYHVTWQSTVSLADVDAAWQAPNRAHGFRTYFTDDGIRVVPRAEEQPSWDWGLSFVGYGRGRLVQPVPRATPSPDEKRVDYARGYLVEWYVNDHRGIKQGFTLSGPPEDVTAESIAAVARADDAAVLLVLEMHGTLQARLSPDGQAVDLVGASSPISVARYGGLIVRDATERELPAWMELVAGTGAAQLYLLFDDRDAIWPVTVDPLLQSEAWSKEGNQTDAQFGFSVAGAGDVNGDDYDDVLVGAPNFDAGKSNQGRVFVYHGSASGIESFPAWIGQGEDVDDHYGWSVASAGDVNGDGFDDVIAGAPGCATVYVYQGSPLGVSPDSIWSEDKNDLWQFGYSVSTAGDVNNDGYDDVLVGAPFQGWGTAYVYHGSADGLTDPFPGTYWRGTDQSGSWFGYVVTTVGDVNGDGYDDVAVSAPKYDDENPWPFPDEEDVGGVWVFHGSATGLSKTAAPDWGYVPPWPEHGYYGQALSAAGDVNGDGYDDLIIGQHRRDGGWVYVYAGGPGGIASAPPGAWTAYPPVGSDTAFREFGWSVSSAGDVNLDGYDDIIVGARDLEGVGESGAFVYLGLPAEQGYVSVNPGWIVSGGASAGNSPQMGYSVAGAGDVNGDGYDDVIVGAPMHDGDKTNEGRAIVYHGAADPGTGELAQNLFGGNAGITITDAGGALSSGSSIPWDDVPSDSSETLPSVYYGSVPNSVVISTGLAQHEGSGNTDFGLDGMPDVTQWFFEVEVPEGAQILRFTTQLITSELERTPPRSDTLQIWVKFPGAGWQEVLDTKRVPTTSPEQPPMARGVSVEMANPPEKIKLGFSIEDAVDGRYDTAVIVSDMFFSDIPLTEGRDQSQTPDDTPEWLSNPSPQDTSAIAGTYSYGISPLSVPGFGLPFDFSIRYNSASTEWGTLGGKWSHSYEARVQKIKDQVTAPNGSLIDVDVVIVRPGGGMVEYFRCVKPPVGDHSKCYSGDPYEPQHAGVYSTLHQTASSPSGSFEYETKNHVTYLFDVDLANPDGTLTDEYENYALETITDTNGNVVTLYYDINNRLDYVIDTRGKLFTFNYDPYERLVSVESFEAEGVAVTFQYDVFSGMLSSFTDLSGARTSFTYDVKGNLLTCTDDDGVVLADVNYEEYVAGAGHQQIGHRVFERRNASPGDPGLNLIFAGDTVETRKREGGIEISRYDVKGQVHEQKVYLGGSNCGSSSENPECWAVTEMTYQTVCIGGAGAGNECATDTDCQDSFCGSTGSPVSQKDPLGGITEMAYDGRGNVIYRKNALGRAQVMHYDERDNLVMQGIPADGHPCIDADCCLGSAPWDTVNCDVTTFEYYPGTDNLKQRTDPEGNAVTYTYTFKGQVWTVTDGRANGATPADPPPGPYYSETVYSTLGYPETEIDRLGRATTHTYNILGQRTSTTDARGHTTSWVLDPLGRVEEQIDALGNSTTHTYDVHGRTLSTQDAADATYSYAYTPTGQRESEADPLGHTTTFEYDTADRLTSRTDPLGNVTRYVYDVAGRTTDVIDDLGGTASATYDKLGNRVALTEPRGHTTLYTYDALGQLTREEDPLGNTLAFTHDHRGLLSTRTNARDCTDDDGDDVCDGPATFSQTYDRAGRLTQTTFAGGATISHTLDPNGSATLSASTHAEIRGVSRTFDWLDRLQARSDTFGNTVEYEYDEVGNLTRLTYPTDADDSGSPDAVIYTYDELNRLETVTDWNGKVTTYSYDAVGNLDEVLLPDGNVVAHTYDAARRLTEVSDNGDDYEYQASFTLDSAGRQTGVSETSLLVGTMGDSERTFTYDAANQLEGYSHDADGNMTAGVIGGAALTLEYNELNQLVRAGSNSYEYDADGFRVVVNGDRRFVYDTTGSVPRLLEEHDGAGNLVARYVHGVGLISRDDGDLTGYRVYHHDTRGSTLALTDQFGSITDLYAYAPYGAVLGHTDGSLTDCDSVSTCTTNPFTYNGRDGVHDDGNGLYLMRTRYYAPELMRFIQRDQVFDGAMEDPQTLNRYAYVGGNPIQRVDPNGEFWGVAFGAIWEGALELGGQLLAGNGLDELNWRAIGAAAAGGAVEGLVAQFCPLGCGAAGAALGAFTNQLVAGKGFDPGSIALAAGLGKLGDKVNAKAVGKKALREGQQAFTKAGREHVHALLEFGIRPNSPIHRDVASQVARRAGFGAHDKVWSEAGKHIPVWTGSATSIINAGYGWLTD